MKKKILIIGSGFNALSTAFFFNKRGDDVNLYFENNLKGVLGSIKIENENFDLGYQFFDGLDKETENFIKSMFGSDSLHNFKYGASTFSNNHFYAYHAIPYWPTYGKLFVFKAFIFYLISFFKNLFFHKKKNENLGNAYNDLPPNIKSIIEKACKKHFQISSDKLAVNAYQWSTFTQIRQTLFNDKISNFLKKNSKFFDEKLASRRLSNSKLENISLYPKNKNMEYIADKLINNLTDNGVIFKKTDLNDLKIDNFEKKIKINNEIFDKIIVTTGLENSQRLFKTNINDNVEHFVSQIFLYFTVKFVNFKFQYTHINDVDLICSRISNCSLYSKLTKEGNNVLIAEVPLSIENELWENDDKLKLMAWNEIQKCGMLDDKSNYKSVKIIKVKKTVAVPKVHYYETLNKFKEIINKKYKNNVEFIGQGIISRHNFVKELLKKSAQL